MRNPLGLKRSDPRLLTRKRKQELLRQYDRMAFGYLPRISDHGGYEFVYYGHDLPYSREVFQCCWVCASKLGDKCIAYEVYWEGPDLECEVQGEDCDGVIKSAYGTPNEEEAA